MGAVGVGELQSLNVRTAIAKTDTRDGEWCSSAVISNLQTFPALSDLFYTAAVRAPLGAIRLTLILHAALTLAACAKPTPTAPAAPARALPTISGLGISGVPTSFSYGLSVQLKAILTRAFSEVLKTKLEKKLDMRMAAYCRAVSRVAGATRERGLYP